jgi:hypothetical protein
MRSAPPPQSRASLLAAGARRFVVLLLVIAGVTAAASFVLGLAAGVSTSRAVSLGFYLVGSFLTVAGFFLGNRGPARLTSDPQEGLDVGRRVRWASRDERVTALNESAIFVAIGVVLLVLGVLVDARVRLV